MALSKVLLLSCFLLVALVLVSNVVAEEAEEQLKGEEVLDTDQYGGYPGRGYGGYPGRGYGGYPGRGYGGYPGRGYGGYPGRGYPGRGGYRCRYYCGGRCCTFAEVQGKSLP